MPTHFSKRNWCVEKLVFDEVLQHAFNLTNLLQRNYVCIARLVRFC